MCQSRNRSLRSPDHARHKREPFKSLRHEIRVFNKVRGGIDDARNKDFIM
jgi:hypothetical protein